MFRNASLVSGLAGSSFPVYKFDKWQRKGLQMSGILLRIAYPITVTVGTWTVAAFATLAVAILNAAIGAFTLSYGSQGQFKPYVAVQGAELRNVHRMVTTREVPNTLPTANVTVGTYTWTVDLFIPFAVPLLKNGRKRLPGYSQIRTMQLEITEGAAYTNTATGTAARTSGANVVIDVDPVCIAGKTDQWSVLLSYYRTNTTDFECVGPDGTHLAAWDDNAGIASTAITLYSAYADGAPLAESMPTYAPDDRYIDEWCQGGAAIDDTETVVLSPELNQAVEELPHGKFSLKLPSMYVATIKLRGLYWPAATDAEAAEAAKMGADAMRGGVLLTVDTDAVDMDAKAARTLPFVISSTQDPDFTLKPGVLCSAPGVNPTISVPQHIKDAVSAATNAAGTSGPASAEAGRAASLTNVAKLIPGMAQLAASVGMAASAQKNATLGGQFARYNVAL